MNEPAPYYRPGAYSRGLARDRDAAQPKPTYPYVPHSDGIGDTGDGYKAVKGWHLTCLWCPWATVQRTKALAVQAYRQHERVALHEEQEAIAAWSERRDAWAASQADRQPLPDLLSPSAPSAAEES